MPFVEPGHIAPGPDGAIWYGQVNRIGRLTTASVFTAEYIINSNSPYPDFVFDAEGTIWFIDDKVPYGINRLNLPRRGDANADKAMTVADVFYLINYLFAGGTEAAAVAQS